MAVQNWPSCFHIKFAMSVLLGHSELNIISDNPEALGETNEIPVLSPKKRKRDGSHAGDIAIDPTPVQPGIAPSLEIDPLKTVSSKKKKKKGDDASSISFVYASKDLKSRTVPVSLYVRTVFLKFRLAHSQALLFQSLRSVVMTIMGDKPMAQYTKFICAPVSLLSLDPVRVAEMVVHSHA